MLARGVERRGGPLRQRLLALQIALLASCMLCGLHAEPPADASAPWVVGVGMLGAAAMGVQNAAARLAFSDLMPTTVMTGNITQLVIDLVDLLRGATDASLCQRIHKLLWPTLRPSP